MKVKDNSEDKLVQLKLEAADFKNKLSNLEVELTQVI